MPGIYLIDNIGMLLSSFSRVQFFVIPWTVAHQAPLSMDFSQQEYWNRLPFPSSGDLPNPGMEPASPALQKNVLLLSHWERFKLASNWHAAAAAKSRQPCPTLCDPIDGSR